MNKFIGAGSLPRNAVLNGNEKKVLRFTLATQNGRNNKNGKARFSFVPCVVFRPSENTQKLLIENGKGLLVRLEGRVHTSKFESKGITRYSTEVIVNENSIQTLAVGGNLETANAGEQ